MSENGAGAVVIIINGGKPLTAEYAGVKVTIENLPATSDVATALEIAKVQYRAYEQI